MSRTRWAMLLNIVVPGSGLIALRREWLGLSVAIWFSVSAQAAVLGHWILPSEIPGWFVLSGAVLALAAYIFGQALFVRQARLIESPQLDEDLAELCERCRAAIVENDLATADRAIDMARRLNDEHPAAALLRSKILAVQGNKRLAASWARFAKRCGVREAG